MSWSLVTAPATEPLTTQEAKDHLRVTNSDDDTYIDGLVTTAREWAESNTERAFITQTWDYFLDAFPADGFFRLPVPPLISVASVKYTDDPDGTVATFASSKYFVDTASEPGRIYLDLNESWPSDTLRVRNGVEVQFDAGYGAASDIPKRAKHLIYLLIGHWYNNREALITGTISKEIELAVESLSGQLATIYSFA